MTQHAEGAAPSSGDLERTFTAVPPARGRGFATTWWGVQWVRALEETALEAGQLRLGRRLARAGAVGAVTVRPGRVTAVVRDPDGTAHRADALLRALDDAEWDRLLAAAAAEAGHLAALLDDVLPPRLVEDAADAGVDLLPGMGDLEAECGCGAWDLCGHTAALCYQVARLLDGDPFVLLLLRGRARQRVLDAVRSHSAARAASGEEGQDHREGEEPFGDQTGGPVGVPAEEVFAARADRPPLPVFPAAPPPPAAGPPAFGAGPAAPGLDQAALELLVSAGAARARRLLRTAAGSEGAAGWADDALTRWQDAVRLAAARPAPRIEARLAERCGQDVRRLRTAALAWRHGEAAALAVWEEEWSPPPEVRAGARALVEEAWADAAEKDDLTEEGNRWTAARDGVQLRYGRDGRWWPFRASDGDWLPAGGPEHDPAAALAVLYDDEAEGQAANATGTGAG